VAQVTDALNNGSVVTLLAVGSVVAHRYALRPHYIWPRIILVGALLVLSVLTGLLISPRPHVEIVPFIAIAAVASLFLFFRFTRSGLAIRAAAADQEAALTQGVSPGAALVTACVLAGTLYALAGFLMDPDHLWLIALETLPVLLLCRLMSLRAAVLGGILIGLAESLFG
jgi:branched-chain amino acid transport system permease protein